MNNVRKYYAFDWDDNILHMPTPIHMVYQGMPIDILPEQFAKIRKDPNWSLGDKAFDEFRDCGPRGKAGFINDIDNAIANKKYGPSWNEFVRSIIDGDIIMIITARGHEPNILKSAVRHIIRKYFTPDQKRTMKQNLRNIINNNNIEIKSKKSLINWYLDQCMFMGVYSNHFEKTFNISLTTAQSERAKEMILDHFITELNTVNQNLGYQFTVGVSDDDNHNINVIKKFFKKSQWSNVVGLYVYDTSNPENIIKTKF